jgi:hypothetical protein
MVFCGTSVRASAAFVVGSKLAPAQVILVKSDFTQDVSGAGNVIEYGLALLNRSLATDAIEVGFTVEFLDTQGRSVTSDSSSVTAIPAGGTFYVSGDALSNVSLTVASMQVAIRVEKSQPKRLTLPSAHARLTIDPEFGPMVSGTLTNPYSQPLPSDATIYVTFLDSAGTFLGGASEQTSAEVQPGATVNFEPLTDAGIADQDWARAASAEVSVDPCGSIYDPNGCPVANG